MVSGALGAAAVGATLAVVPTGPANAHPATQGRDFAEHFYGGWGFWVCDRESDDHSVWAEFYLDKDYDRRSAPVSYGGINCSDVPLGGWNLTNLRVVEVIPTTGTRYYGAWHGANFNN